MQAGSREYGSKWRAATDVPLTVRICDVCVCVCARVFLYVCVSVCDHNPKNVVKIPKTAHV